MTAPHVQLDSLDRARGGRSFRFAGYRETIRADSLDEVIPVMAAVEAATGQGLHAVGFVAYEAAAAFDPALATRRPAAGFPLAWWAIFSECVETDAPLPAATDVAPIQWQADTSEAEHASALARIRDLLAAGDTYQVNHTFRLRAPFAGDPLELYRQLAHAQRSAFCAFLDIGSHAVVSASPELFFAWNGQDLTLRPMKGTRPRGRWPAEDDALVDELIASPKDRAENLMIVDLLRNDAGRVAVPGSVRVERMFEVERYDTVLQLTSTIRARTRPDATLTGIFRALFPCGSVTGAPKVRTMQIISELEGSPRGAYCGAIGVASPGEAIFSVGIRTVVVDHAGGTAELGVGSGVTWDSRPEAEYRECLDKASFAGRQRPRFDLLETLLYEPGSGYFLLDGHLHRMAQSANRLGFRFDRRAVVGALHAAVASGVGGRQRVRLTIARDGEPVVLAEPLAAAPSPVRVAISRAPVASRELLLFHKTTDRARYDDRRAEHPGADDVLLVNERGELTESTIANLVVALGGRLVTPALRCGALPGVFREMLVRRSEVVEGIITPAQLASAETIWLVSSVRRWRRAVLV